MNRKLLILNIVLIVILIIEVSMITIAYTTQKATNSKLKSKPNISMTSTSKPPSPTPSSSSNTLGAPQLPTSLNWNPVDQSDTNSIYNNNKGSFIYASHAEDVDIKGSEWVSVQENESDSIKEYQSTLLKNGWSNYIRYNNRTIATVAADGPTGGVWGYLKVVDEKITVIAISLRTVSKNSTRTTYPCPCNYEYRVFISTPVSISEALKATKD